MLPPLPHASCSLPTRCACLPPPGHRALPALLCFAARCEGAGAYVGGVHTLEFRVGALDDGFAGTMLVGAYVACGRVGDTRKVFYRMTVLDVVSWA